MYPRPSLSSGSGLALVALLAFHLSGCGFERIPVHA